MTRAHYLPILQHRLHAICRKDPQGFRRTSVAEKDTPQRLGKLRKVGNLEP